MRELFDLFLGRFIFDMFLAAPSALLMISVLFGSFSSILIYAYIAACLSLYI